MKWLIAVVAPMVLGFLVGHDGRTFSANETQSVVQQTGAITFTGDFTPSELETFDKRSSSGQYRLAELRDVHREALEALDFGLLKAIEKEWSKSEDGSGIAALFAAGDDESAWRILSEWSRSDPLAAARVAVSLSPTRKDTVEIVNRVLEDGISELLRTEPEKLLETGWIEKLSGENFSSPRQEVDSMSIEDIENALETLSDVSDHRARENFAGLFLYEWAEKKPDEAIRWVEENIAMTNREYYWETVFSAISMTDPRRALELFGSMLDDADSPTTSMSALLSGNISSDKEMLEAWLREQPSTRLRVLADQVFREQPYLGSLRTDSWNILIADLGPQFEWMKVPEEKIAASVTWPVSNLDEARTYMEKNLPRIEVFGNSDLEWTPETMNQTVDMLQTAGEFSAPYAYDIAKSWARTDPHTAFEWASGLDADLRIGASEAALGAWFGNEPGKAVAYVDSLPNSEFRRYAVERVAMDWLDSAPESAAQWINQMPQGIDRDIGKREIAATFRQRNPKRAYLNANAINHPVMRDEALEQVFDVWFRRDATEAAEYLKKTDLPAERRAAIGNR